MKKNIILILGSGHLSYRVKKLLLQAGYGVVHTDIDAINKTYAKGSFLENVETYLKKTDIATMAMVYLLEEKDENNLQLILALISLDTNIPITASLFNENIIPHLLGKYEHLKILNPAKIAAPFFVEAVYAQRENFIVENAIENNNNIAVKRKDFLIEKLVLVFIGLLMCAVVFFHFSEHLGWVDSLYFVVVTVATVGYGDISLLHSTSMSKLFAVFLILASTVFLWMIFSLTIDRLIKKRIQLAMGRKKYHCQNHIIVCGLGRLGYFIVADLLKRNEKVIIVEQNEDASHCDYFRGLGAEVYIGDARLTKVLDNVNVSKAKALISVVNNDAVNLEIGLNARSFKPDIKLIIRIFDQPMAEKIKAHLNIFFTLSASAITDDSFYEALLLYKDVEVETQSLASEKEQNVAFK